MNVKSSRSYHHARFQRPCSQSIPENTDAKCMFFCLFFLFFLKHETHQLSPLTFYSMISMCVVLKNKQQTNKNILLLSDEKFFKKTKNTNNIHINLKNFFKHTYQWHSSDSHFLTLSEKKPEHKPSWGRFQILDSSPQGLRQWRWTAFCAPSCRQAQWRFAVRPPTGQAGRFD